MEENGQENSTQDGAPQVPPSAVPPQQPEPLTQAPMPQPGNPKEPFYKKTWFIVVLLLLFPPAGIPLAWVFKKPGNKAARIVLTVISALVVVYVLAPKTSTTTPEAPQKELQSTQEDASPKQAEPEKVDKTSLKKAVDEAAVMDLSKYTAESVTAFTTSLDKANVVLADESAKKNDVSSAASSLSSAKSGLVIRVDPVVVSGSGDDVVEIPAALSVCLVSASNSGSGNFAIWSLDSNNENIDLLVNEIGAYEGTTTTGMRNKTAKYLQVTSSGDWTITMSPITQAPIVENGAANVGDSVVVLAAGSTGKLTFTNDGDSNFAVHGISKSGGDLLVNEIGSYSGSVPNKGYSVLIVSSNGTWTVSW